MGNKITHVAARIIAVAEGLKEAMLTRCDQEESRLLVAKVIPHELRSTSLVSQIV
jgi:hypothetical protein